MSKAKFIQQLLLIPLFLMLYSYAGADEIRKISGTVYDESSKEPLIGVALIIKGTTAGILTNVDGEFVLSTDFDMKGKTLLVSYIGFKTKEIVIEDQQNFKIYLEEQAALLEDVIVIGLATKKQSNMSSASKIRIRGSAREDIALDKPVNNKSKAPRPTTWKRSGLADNSIRLEVGDDDFLPLESAQVTVQVDGFRARVLIDCYFYNNKGNNLEGTFKLKLPNGGSPFYLAFGTSSYLHAMKGENEDKTGKGYYFQKYNLNNFSINYQKPLTVNANSWHNVKEAIIAPKQQAAEAYEATRAKKVDPALMEWGGADMYSCSVYPLFNNTLHRIVIGYDVYLTEGTDFREYILGLPKVKNELKVDIVLSETENTPVEISTKNKPAETGLNRIMYSFTNPKEKEIVIRYDSDKPIMLIQYQKSNDKVAAHNESLAIPYFATSCRVNNLPQQKREDLPETAVFVLDTSLSSDPDKFNIWLKILEELLNSNEQTIKQFALLSFGIDGHWYKNEYLPNNKTNRAELMKYVNNLALEGATNLQKALKMASNPSWLHKDENKAKLLFLLSDGDANWGEIQSREILYEVKSGDPIYTFKTNMEATNISMLDKLSKETGGLALSITGEEEIATLANALQYKTWQIENVEAEGTQDMLIAGNPTEIYDGQKLIFTGRNIPTGFIKLKLKCGKEEKELIFTPYTILESSLVSRIYGQIACSYLEDEGELAKNATIQYSTYYKVPGEYTSLVMLESTWDYKRFGISEDDCHKFIEKNMVTNLLADYNKMSLLSFTNTKIDFIQALEALKINSSQLYLTPEIKMFMNKLPESAFRVNITIQGTAPILKSMQTRKEQASLKEEKIDFDKLYLLTKERKDNPGEWAAMSLASSALEKNAADTQTRHDMAALASNYGFYDDAYFLMKRISDARPSEALPYLKMADALANSNKNQALALIYYYIAINGNWTGDIGNIKEIAAIKAMQYCQNILSKKIEAGDLEVAFANYLYKMAEIKAGTYANITDADILIIVDWNQNQTDIDLHVMEPTGQTCSYKNVTTTIGGRLTKDVRQSYGPEMYVLKNAVPGKYRVILDFYASNSNITTSKPKSYISVYENFGRENQQVTNEIVVLERAKDNTRMQEQVFEIIIAE